MQEPEDFKKHRRDMMRIMGEYSYSTTGVNPKEQEELSLFMVNQLRASQGTPKKGDQSGRL